MNGALMTLTLLAASGFQVLSEVGDIERISPPVADAGSSARPLVGDGEQLILGDAARIVLGNEGIWIEAAGEGRLLVTGERQLRWQGRRLRAVVAGEPLKIETTAGTVRMTEGRFRLRQNGATTAVEALTGSGARVFANGEVYEVTAGQGFLASAGAISIAELPGAPSLIRPRPHASLKGFRFQWAGAKGALGYVWEMASDPGFEEILLRAEVDRPAFSRPSQTLPIGLVFWRVSVISATGMEGMPSEPSPLRINP